MLEEFRKLGVLQTVVLPAGLLFLIPLLSLVVCQWGEAKYDRIILDGIAQSIQNDPGITPDQRAQALAFLRDNPTSTLLTSDAPEARQFTSQLPETLRSYYFSFRWLTRLALFCILSGLGLIALVAISAPLTQRSQRGQYVSLWAGWHATRLFLTLQVIAQAILVVGLSFWITALLANTYSLQLVGTASIIALGVVFLLLKEVFTRVRSTFHVAGEILRPADAPALWQELQRVANTIGTGLPDQVLIGIDDNFFVTEYPVVVAGQTVRGKTLFVSLAMIKALSGDQADAILAHEFAHFSGNDTYYSRRIGPLLNKFNYYLRSLHANTLIKPMFSFALLIRQLYEVSIQKLSRDREFRADALAAEAVSPRALGDALVRTLAYSTYRQGVEQELFDSQTSHDQVAIGQRLDAGFRQFALGFADLVNLREGSTTHPFDSHPSLEQRLEAVGRPIDGESLRQALAAVPDGAWYARIPDAERREAALWNAYEEGFRQAHSHSLIYRYLPATPEEAAVVARAFPEVTLRAKKKTVVTIDHAAIHYPDWPEPVRFDQIAQILTRNEWGTPTLDFHLLDGRHQMLPMNSNQNEQQRLIGTIRAYWERCGIAIAYHKQRQAQFIPTTKPNPDATADAPEPTSDAPAQAINSSTNQAEITPPS